jgi:hypothetical protein
VGAGQSFYSGCSEAEFQAQSPNCTITSGEDIIRDFDMDFVGRGEALLVVACLFSVMWFGAYMGLRKVMRQRLA